MTRMTVTVAKVLVALDRDGGERYGLDLAREIGCGSGTLYTVLERMETAGLVEGRFEEPPLDGRRLRRPTRRFYRLTPAGATRAAEASARLREETAKLAALLQPASG